MRSACQSLGSSRISIWITRLGSKSASPGDGPGTGLGCAAKALAPAKQQRTWTAMSEMEKKHGVAIANLDFMGCGYFSVAAVSLASQLVWLSLAARIGVSEGFLPDFPMLTSCAPHVVRSACRR